MPKFINCPECQEAHEEGMAHVTLLTCKMCMMEGDILIDDLCATCKIYSMKGDDFDKEGNPITS